ncbi:MAG: hypothetical protein U9N57_04895 [Pseudomonadota bacterium]|nr:hypothetical protein [Pseudomonadota bacterium]
MQQSGLFIGTFGFLAGYFDSQRFNTYVYFGSNSALLQLLRQVSRARVERIPCLVISARFLDEALLALSAEAVAYALLGPRIRDFFGLPAERSMADGQPVFLKKASRLGRCMIKIRMWSLALLGWLSNQFYGRTPPIGAQDSDTVGPYKFFGMFVLRLGLGLCYLLLIYWWWQPIARLVLIPRTRRLIMNVLSSFAVRAFVFLPHSKCPRCSTPWNGRSRSVWPKNSSVTGDLSGAD